MSPKLEKRWDVFLSHAGSDEAVVGELAERLLRAGLKPFLDKWHLVPGEAWQEALETALDESFTCAVFLGPEGLGPWQNEEMRSALEVRVREPGFRVIPVLLPGAPEAGDAPRFLRRLTWVDFRPGLDDPETFDQLLCGVLGIEPGPEAAGARPLRIEARLRQIPEDLEAVEGARRVWGDEMTDRKKAELAEEREKLRRTVVRPEGIRIEARDRTIEVDGSVTGSVLVTGDRATVVVGGRLPGQPELPPSAPSKEEARREYLKRMRAWWCILPLASLGGEPGEADQVTLDRVYIEMDTRSRVRLTEEEAQERERPDRAWPGEEGETRPLSAREAVAALPRLVLLGDPGAGKSTFVRDLLYETAGAQLGVGGAAIPEGLEPNLLPVLLVLRDVSGRLEELELDELTAERREEALAGVVLEEALAELSRRRVEGFRRGLTSAWQDGRCLLVLDGLDEVPPGSRALVGEAVAATLRLHHRFARVIVTCRVRSYHGEAELPGFEVETLAPFDEDKIDRFCRTWYRARFAAGLTDEETAQAQGESLASAALASELRELAENPMLLTTMALVHQKEVGLPRERVKLFDKAVEVLLWRWQKRKAGARLVPSKALSEALADEPRMRQVLQRLAFEAHRSGGRKEKGAAGLTRGRALELLEAPESLGDPGLAGEFLDYVDHRAGLLVGHGGADARPEVYSFPHRTFQEYLAGRYLLAAGDPAAEYYERAGEGDLWSVAAELGAEALLYVDGYPNFVRKLAYELCPEGKVASDRDRRAVLWSAKVAALLGAEEIERDTAGPQKGPAYIKRLLPRLGGLLASRLPALERAEAGRVLARLGDPRKEVTTVDGMEFCWVPAGEFWLGSGEEDEQAHADEEPQRKLDIPYGYWLGRFPVTQAQFREFVAARGYEEERYWPEAREAGFWKSGKVEDSGGWNREPRSFGEPFDLPNHPVVGVSWYEALAFCRWLEEWWGGRGWLPAGWAVRLPSEAEWEKAARGGLEIPRSQVKRQADQGLGQPEELEEKSNRQEKRRFPWTGDLTPERANYPATGVGFTTAVGSFPRGRSPYGCEELTGNVWEWTCSLWSRGGGESRSSYPYDPTDGREDLAAGRDAPRVLRGGAFYSAGSLLRCSYRFWYSPGGRNPDLGYRLLLSPILL